MIFDAAAPGTIENGAFEGLADRDRFPTFPCMRHILRLALPAAACAAALFLASCLAEDPIGTSSKKASLDSAGVRIIPNKFSAGDTARFEGILKSERAPLEWVDGAILQGGRTAEPGKEFSILRDSIPAGRNQWNLMTDMDLAIVAGADAAPGEYQARIRFKAGDSVLTVVRGFQVLAAPEITFTGLSTSPKAILRGGEAAISGTVAADLDIDSVTFEVSGASGPAQGFSFRLQPVFPGRQAWSLSDDGDVRISVSDLPDTGTYMLHATAWAAGKSLTKQAPFRVIDWLPEKIVSTGAQLHPTLGTAMDLDAPEALTSARAHAAQESLDLLFVYFEGQLRLMSAPEAIKTGLNVASYDPTKVRETKMVRVAGKPVWPERDFVAGVQVTTMPAQAGYEFMMKSSKGEYLFVTVKSVTGTDGRATAELSVAALPAGWRD